ncbi:MAG: efflux RND transporter periplasmic adaptor subunit [Deltaproteobacteria bacterium]|nr:efflux RND transporter periplasmic adaptor subunit [Deltaproteobacteria bacterium]MBW2116662.1 efflux RND transporter periplasmic adaptor subunit [Deltaproteobacteria bacterium]MBW2343229.1 efflux RND transporter periplasmic adaptor subunit [Deltaproteobacteria bacterium]
MDIENDRGSKAMTKTKRRLFQFVITVALIALGALGMNRLMAGKTQLKKQKPSVPAPMVRTIRVETGPQSVRITGEGTVRPLRQINLVPQVGGKVVFVSSSLINGGEFKKGETLLRIDPEDYRLAVTLAEAKIKDSESKLRFVEEESAAAREEWYLHRPGGFKTNKKPPPLVTKEPQLAAAGAKVEADGANLRKALLNLERTELLAPFNGRVSQENVDIGQYVSPGPALAVLYSTDAAEIVLPLEDEDLFWFHVPDFTPGKGPGSAVTVRARIAGHDMSWPGKVVRAEGKLDERTRMINVVVRVKKPYEKKPPLAAGLFVTVDVEGRSLPKAAVIPRSALHQGHVVWVVDNNGLLHFRKVGVARIQGDGVLIKAGLKDGEMIVVSPLKAVSDGMIVRTVPVKEENGS